jgi:hypothetical protein
MVFQNQFAIHMNHTNTDIKKIEEEVQRFVDSLRDNPSLRLESREAFYKKYGASDATHPYGFGDSEIAFLNWEIRRGVLSPPTTNPPGSQWWSEVNLWFIYLCEVGKRVYEANIPASDAPVASQLWIEYIKSPNAQNWYRAHNSSIIDGYLKFMHLTKQESDVEIIFMNMVMYRLLFAQGMVEGDFEIPNLGKFLANPKGDSVDIITHIDVFYAQHYPMNPKEARIIRGVAHNFGEVCVKLFDFVIIAPELNEIYQRASIWNQQPGTINLVKDNEPVYPDGKPHTGRVGWLYRFLGLLLKLFFETSLTKQAKK